MGYARSDSLNKNAVVTIVALFHFDVLLLCCGYAVVMLFFVVVMFLLCFCHAVIVSCCCLDGSERLMTVFFYKVPYRQTELLLEVLSDLKRRR